MSRSPQSDSPSVFLCYAREDFERVHALYALLKVLGLRPWLDKYDIVPGELWPQAIERAIRGADFFIASFSTSSVRKAGFVQREYRFALDALAQRPAGRTFLIPIRLDDCELPDLREVGIRLSDIQWVDLFRTGPLAESDVEPILKAIEAQSGWRRPRRAGLAEVVTAYGGKLDQRIMSALTVRELPYTDSIIELESRTPEREVLRLGEAAYRRYLAAGAEESYRLGHETFYLIARHLYREILEDNFGVCRHKPFIYPVHQYLSGMIRGAAEGERQRVLSTLRRWLESKRDIYETSRDFAAFELGMSKACGEKGALFAALEDIYDLPLVRYYAAMSLGMTGCVEDVPRLVEIFRREAAGDIKDVVAHVIIHLSGGL